MTESGLWIEERLYNRNENQTGKRGKSRDIEGISWEDGRGNMECGWDCFVLKDMDGLQFSF